jgi:5-methylcytosine-specific restriction endonuclease McrA
LGGTSDPRNVIFLCRDCHSANTAYLKELFPKYFLRKKEKVLENGDVQLMF